MHSDVPYVQEALQAGAIAYVLKDAGVEELIKAIREAAAGRRFLTPSVHQDLLLAGRPRLENGSDPYQSLSHREREVLQLTVEGHSGNEIAERLFISPRTVESHRANVMRKLNVRNQKELVRYAMQRGILAKE
jgi:two-component system response regulator NreC